MAMDWGRTRQRARVHQHALGSHRGVEARASAMPARDRRADRSSWGAWSACPCVVPASWCWLCSLPRSPCASSPAAQVLRPRSMGKPPACSARCPAPPHRPGPPQPSRPRRRGHRAQRPCPSPLCRPRAPRLPPCARRHRWPAQGAPRRRAPARGLGAPRGLSPRAAAERLSAGAALARQPAGAGIVAAVASPATPAREHGLPACARAAG